MNTCNSLWIAVGSTIFGLSTLAIPNNAYATEIGYMTNEQIEVWRVVEEFNEAFESNDLELFFSFVADEITVLTPGHPFRVEGIEDDREEIEKGISEGYGTASLWQAMQPHVRVRGHTALVSFFSRGYLGTPPIFHYLRVTNLLARTGGNWKVVHIHVSEIPEN